MSRTNIQGQGRGQIFEDKDEDKDKILTLRPTCPRGLNITAYDRPTSSVSNPSCT